MNYDKVYEVPGAVTDDRTCQEKVKMSLSLKNCKKDGQGFPINPGKIESTGAKAAAAPAKDAKAAPAKAAAPA